MTQAVRGHVYTARQIYQELDLFDRPSLCFAYEGIPTIIQDSHVSEEAILAIDDGFLDTEWEFASESVLVPIFVYCSTNSNILNFVDVVPWTAWDGSFMEGTWWATLRDYPKVQPQFEATLRAMSVR